jgi:signal transduction histidine kinase
VTVRTGSDGLQVEVHDNGAGPAAAIRPGYGLAGITERVQRLGGTLYTGRGRDGTGFRIDARLPAFPPT